MWMDVPIEAPTALLTLATLFLPIEDADEVE